MTQQVAGAMASRRTLRSAESSSSSSMNETQIRREISVSSALMTSLDGRLESEVREDKFARNTETHLINHSTTAIKRPSAFVIQVTVIASLGGILFGYDLGVISGALPQLVTTFNLTSRQQELCVSILYLGGGLGAAIGGSLCDAYGRKRAIVLCDIVFGIGALILYAAPNFEFIVVGRVVVGFAIALSGISDVTYLHEIAPVQFRGAIVSVNEACISLGFLLAFGVGSALSAEGNTNGWRMMFGVSGLVALVQLIGMLPMPESPNWLAEQGRHEESETALRRIQSDYVLFQSWDGDLTNPTESYQAASPVRTSFAAEINDSAPDLTLDFNNEVPSYVRRISVCCIQVRRLYKRLYVFIVTMFTEYRRQTYITIFLAVTQQLCGQTNVLSYAPLIFATAAGADASSSSSYVQGWATLSIGLVKFAVTVLVIWKIESIGRRVLLLWGMGTVAAGLLFIAVAFAGASVPPPDGIEVNVVGDSRSRGLYLALPGVLLVVCGYSMSFGPLTWLLTSELFPTDIRGRALGVSTIITYLCASLVTFTFLSAQALVGASIVFMMYLFVTCTGLIFALLAIPDTGGKNANEIEGDLDSMLWWQRRGRGLYDISEQEKRHFAETEMT